MVDKRKLYSVLFEYISPFQASISCFITRINNLLALTFPSSKSPRHKLVQKFSMTDPGPKWPKNAYKHVCYIQYIAFNIRHLIFRIWLRAYLVKPRVFLRETFSHQSALVESFQNTRDKKSAFTNLASKIRGVLIR